MDLTLKSRRKLWLKVHLYLGLVVGAVFVLIGLTGSLLAFESALDERLNSTLMTVSSDRENKDYLPPDVLVASGLSALPANGNALSLALSNLIVKVLNNVEILMELNLKLKI